MNSAGTCNLTIIILKMDSAETSAAEMLASERRAESIDPLCKLEFVGLGCLKRVSDLKTLKAFTVLAWVGYRCSSQRSGPPKGLAAFWYLAPSIAQLLRFSSCCDHFVQLEYNLQISPMCGYWAMIFSESTTVTLFDFAVFPSPAPPPLFRFCDGMIWPATSQSST